MHLKLLTLFACLICSLYADGNFKDSLPATPDINKRLKILFNAIGLKCQSQYRMFDTIKYGLILDLKMPLKYDSVVSEDSLKLAIDDFALFDSAHLFGVTKFHYIGKRKEVLSYCFRPKEDSLILKRFRDKLEYLSPQRKADLLTNIIKTKWDGFIWVNEDNRSVYFDFTVPKKEYTKRKMRRLAGSYAALAYCWLLRNVEKKNYSMMVHFRKKKRNKVMTLEHRVYSFCSSYEDYYDELSKRYYTEFQATIPK